MSSISNCKICYHLPEPIRVQINDMMMEGVRNCDIIRKFPELNLTPNNVARHKPHVFKTEINEAVALEKLKYDLDKAKNVELDLSHLVKVWKERIAYVVNQQTLKLIELEESSTDGDSVPYSDALNNLNKIINSLNSFSGLNSIVSLETAMLEVKKAGYLIVNPHHPEEGN